MFRQRVTEYQSVFNSENGKEVLKDLRRKCITFEKPRPNLTDTQRAYHEGQRSVIMHIYRMLKIDPFGDKLVDRERKEAYIT